ncbi:hypothetical protein D3C80_1879020 [compost metagenome]
MSAYELIDPYDSAYRIITMAKANSPKRNQSVKVNTGNRGTSRFKSITPINFTPYAGRFSH